MDKINNPFDMQLNTVYKEDRENHIFYTNFDFQYEERGLGYHFFKYMQLHKHKIAQYLVDTGVEDTYGEVLERSVRTALHLENKNLTKDDVIVIYSHSTQFNIVAYIASLFLNIKVTSLDPMLSEMEISFLLKEVKPKILFVIPEVLDIAETVMQNAGIEAEIIVFGKSNVYTEFSSFLEPHPDEGTFSPKEIDNVFDTAVILFSSGTTGLPKGIKLSHHAVMTQANIKIRVGAINTVFLSYSSLYWITRIIFTAAICQVGAASVMVTKFDPENCWYLLDKYKVTNLFLMPFTAIEFLKFGRPEGIDTSSLLTFLIAGGNIRKETILELRDLLSGTYIHNGYGQTEAAGATIWFDVTNAKHTWFLQNKPNSVGLILPYFMAKVVNIETENTCGPNEHGELRLKSKAIMSGFYNRDCSEVFDADGWLKTGDIVYYDNDDCFYTVGRIKEMLKYKGWHVSPAMLEQIIENHPAVSRVVVIGKPDDEGGDLLMAVIIRNQSYTESVDEDIINFVANRAPDRMKLRGGVKFVTSFPMTPSGKIKRVLLRDMILNGEI